MGQDGTLFIWKSVFTVISFGLANKETIQLNR